MSDQKKDEELDQVSGGRESHPGASDPIQIEPPTHPGRGLGPKEPINRPTNPVGG